MDADDGRAEPRLRSHALLLALTIALPVAEAVALWRSGLETAMALAPQVTAPAPFGAFHDLRWLLVYHRSWPAFAGEALLALAFRSGVTAATVRAAWPLDNGPPPSGRLVLHAVSFTLASEILLLPFAALLFGMAVTPVSWAFFAALPGAVVVALLIHHGVTATSWWRDAPPPRTTGWLALTFAVLTAGGAAVSVSPPALRLPVVAAVGLFNAWAWLGVVRVLAGRARRRIRPVAPAGIAVLAGAALLGVVVGLAGHRETLELEEAGRRVADQAEHTAPAGRRDDPGRIVRSERQPEPSGRPVLIVSGFNSSWDGRPQDDVLGAGFREHRFSYRGLGADGEPLPYGPRHTHRSLPALVRELGRAVEGLHRATGKEVDVVAESEGSLVTAAYLAAEPASPVRRAVLLSPLVEPGRVAFPARGDEGWGVATGWILRGVSGSVEAVSSFDLAPDSPFIRSLVDGAPVLRDLLRCPPPGADVLGLLPLADAVVSPHPSALAIDDSVVPAFHGGTLSDPTIRRAVALALDRGELPDLSIWTGAERAVSVASAAWQAPALPVTLAWPSGSAETAAPGSVAAGDGGALDCGELRAALRAWLDGHAAGRR